MKIIYYDNRKYINKLTFKCLYFYTLFIYEKCESCLQSKLLRAFDKYI